ncbi:MAG: heavy-metal-associated domain-containing protein [Oscillospiraceae bacterium]
MYKTTVKIDGMACGMCEAHVNDAIRKALAVKKVTASHSKGCAEILSEGEIPEEALRRALDGTGYRGLSVSAEPYQKKGLFRW